MGKKWIDPNHQEFTMKSGQSRPCEPHSCLEKNSQNSWSKNVLENRSFLLLDCSSPNSQWSELDSVIFSGNDSLNPWFSIKTPSRRVLESSKVNKKRIFFIQELSFFEGIRKLFLHRFSLISSTCNLLPCKWYASVTILVWILVCSLPFHHSHT